MPFVRLGKWSRDTVFVYTGSTCYVSTVLLPNIKAQAKYVQVYHKICLEKPPQQLEKVGHDALPMLEAGLHEIGAERDHGILVPLINSEHASRDFRRTRCQYLGHLVTKEPLVIKIWKKENEGSYEGWSCRYVL